MTFAQQQVQVSLLFRDTSSDEIAQTGYRVTNSAAPFDAVLHLAAMNALFAEGIRDEYVTFASTTGWRWADYSQLYAIKAAALDTDGSYLTDAVSWDVADAVGTISDVPPQLTTVLTLWSGSGVGRANYGRLYLPHSVLDQTTLTSRASVTTAQNVATAGAALIEAWSLAHGTLVSPGAIHIMSSVGAGLSKPVAQVGSGRVTDTQRRRRNRLDEDIQYVAL